MKRVVFILWSLLLTSILIISVIVWLLQTTSGAKTTLYLLNSFAPVNIKYSDLKGSISSLNLSGLEIDSDFSNIKADALALDWNPITAFLLDNVQIENFTAKDVSLTFAETKKSSSSRSFENIDWRLPFTMEIRSATIEQLHIPSLHEEPISQLTLSAQLDKEEWSVNQFSIIHPELSSELSGKIIPYDTLTHKFDISLNSPKAGEGSLSLNGNSELSQLKFALAEKGVQINTSLVNWLVNPEINFTADIDSPDLIGLPSKLKINGKGTLNLGNLALIGTIDGQKINVEALNYKRSDGDYFVSSNGIFSDGPYKLKADFSAKELYQSELHWTPKLPNADIQINSSVSRIKGAWDNLNIVNNSQVTIKKQAAKIKLVGQLKNFNELIISPSTVSYLDGEIKLLGKFDLQAELKGKLSGEVARIHLEKLDSKLPELKTGNFDINWDKKDKITNLSADLFNLQAVVKNKTVFGNGKIRLLDGQVSQAKLLLDSGPSNRVSLDLLDSKNQIIAIDANINNLGAFIANASGKLSGQLKVNLKDALMDGRLVAEKIEIPELLSVSEIKLEASHVGIEQVLDIKSSDLKHKNYSFKHSNIMLEGNIKRHQINFELMDSKERTMELSGQAQWLNNEYQLNLQELKSDSPELGLIRNLQPIDLIYSKNEVSITPFCLDSEIAKLCGELQKSESVTGSMNLTIAAVDEHKLISQQVGTVNFVPKTETIVRAKFQFDNERLSKLDFNASLAKLAIRNQESESLEIENIVLLANDDNGKITLSFNADTAGGKLNLLGNVSNSLNNPEIAAVFKVNLPHLEDISPLLISTDINEGDFELEMQINGAIKAPQVSGFAKLNNTKVLIPELGTSQLVTAVLDMQDSQNGIINGTIVSGAGKGDLKGEIKWEKEPVVNISLTGSKLLIADTASLSLSASPKLLLVYAPGTLDLTGLINIDNAFTSLATSGSNASLSNDIIIVDDELNSEVVNTQQIRNIDITTEFSNPSRIDGYGVVGEVTGKLRITQKDSGPVLGNGQLKITGQYKAFGQVLQIESGRLNYVNTALDNPSLDFYASRKVGDVKVGVKVSGRPDALVSRLESTPTMREADILHYLVLGKAPGAASESESGQLAKAAVALALARSESGIQTVANKAGLSELTLTQELGGLALSLGKQLSPRLYIGYTMGFIEPINVARVRYLLSSKWVIESEISEETRAAIKYRFEKD